MTNIDFIGRKYTWFAISVAVILIGLLGLMVKGLTFGIEFKGGTLFDVKFKQAITVEKVRNELKKFQLENSVIQIVGDRQNEVLIKSREIDVAKQEEVTAGLKRIGATDFSVQSVGPSWGQQLTRGTLIALILSLVIVLAFVALRFEFKMGGSAVVALAHDVLIAVGLYALLGREVTTSTVAAFLTILGYSMYDTIVVFDRIRENASGLKKQTYSDMVNQSVNQVLRRSINTTLTSVIPVACLFFFGGETLRDFAFALLVGLISGGYSSVFIASPVLAMWKESEPRYRALRERMARA